MTLRMTSRRTLLASVILRVLQAKRLSVFVGWPGESPLPGLTDEEKPRQRGPKRASKIRRLFNLSKEDDVRRSVSVKSAEFWIGNQSLCPEGKEPSLSMAEA